MKTARIIYDERSDPENPGWFVRYHDDSLDSRVIQEDWVLPSTDPNEIEETLIFQAKLEAPSCFRNEKIIISIENNVFPERSHVFQTWFTFGS